jgi:hypothetical protein
LVAAYIEALGGKARVSPIQLQDIERVVDLILAARTARADLLAGKVTITNVVKLENAVGRALLRLSLPEPNAAAPTPSLADYLASRSSAPDGEG